MFEYDYLIVGAGLYGSVCARELTNLGYKCLVIDKRDHIGGNCYTYKSDDIYVHKYGPHIFHTNDISIWNYVNRFISFNNFTLRTKVNYKDRIYSFPINLMSIYQIYGINNPSDAIEKINEVKIHNDHPDNLEEYILSQVGKDLYEIYIKGYSTKQWGRSPKDLPASIVKRLPIRYNFDDRYFDDKYQGIPINGYTELFECLLNDIRVILNVDYDIEHNHFDLLARNIIYTGPIDRYYNYCYGELEYRTLRFENEYHNVNDYQGTALINYTDVNVPYTRIIEHKHFMLNKSIHQENHTIITKEYPKIFEKEDIPYYPIPDSKNNKLYNMYLLKSKGNSNLSFGGRIGEYKYYDMHQVIASALSFVKDIRK
jgi:UDP-galactopyranose mutase